MTKVKDTKTKKQKDDKEEKQKKPLWKKFLKGLAIYTIVCIVIGTIGIIVTGDVETEESNESNTSSSTENKEEDNDNKEEKIARVEIIEAELHKSLVTSPYVEGKVKNNTTELKSGLITVTFRARDNDRNYLGDCIDSVSKLYSKETWEFKAYCPSGTKDINSGSVDIIEY